MPKMKQTIYFFSLFAVFLVVSAYMHALILWAEKFCFKNRHRRSEEKVKRCFFFRLRSNRQKLQTIPLVFSYFTEIVSLPFTRSFDCLFIHDFFFFFKYFDWLRRILIDR
jgi:hypothetical protein